jgi:CHAT domain-containing protein/Tfp pilus assembly protein PilF
MFSSPTLVATAVCLILLIGPYGLPSAAAYKSQSVPHAGNEQATPSDGKQFDARLDLGHPAEGELAAHGKQTFDVSLTTGQFAKFSAEPQDIDVSVAVIDPSGHQLLKLSSPYGAQGPVDVYILVRLSGSYKLEVEATDNNAHPGRCKVKIRELRVATARDQIRVGALELVTQAQHLREKGTAESRRLAAEKYTQALPSMKRSGDRLGEAQTLDQLGSVLNELGENQKAIHSLKSSLEIFRSIQDRRGEGMVLADLGSVQNDMGDNKESLANLNQALSLRREVGDRRAEGETLELIGDVYENTSDAEKALENYDAALALRRTIGDRRGEAQSLDDIGVVYDDIDAERKGLDYFAQALPIHQALHDSWGEAITLNNYGTAYDSLGEKRKALEYFAKALPLKRETGNRRGEGTTLSNMCWIETTLNEWQTAMEHCKSALEINRAIGDREGEAQTLANLGSLYANLGESQKALRQFESSLAFSRSSGYRLYEGIALNSIGLMFYELGDYPKALANYDLALPIRRAVGDRSGEAATLDNIGKSQEALGQLSLAVDYFSQALGVAQSADSPRWQAGSLGDMGWLFATHGEAQKALDRFNQALPLYQGLGDQRGEAATLFGIARAKRDLGDLQTAVFQIESALRIIETLRSKVTNLQLRSSYSSSVRDYYEFYIDLLMLLDKVEPTKGYGARALEANERSIARSLIETLREARAEIRHGVDLELLEREHSLQQLLQGKTERQMRLLAGKQNNEQVAAAKKEVDDLVVEYQEVEAKIRERSPGYSALTQPQPLDLTEIQKRILDENTILLEYSLGSERSYLWAVTRESFRSFVLPKRVEVEVTARRFYELLTSRNRTRTNETNQQQTERPRPAQSEIADTALRLSRIVLGPVAPLILGKRLAIVADGALQYVPFGALTVPNGATGEEEPRPLVAENEVINLPSASTLGVLREGLAGRQSAPKIVAVLADPVFDRDDSRVKVSAQMKAQQRTAKGMNGNEESTWEKRLNQSRLTRSVSDVGIQSQRTHLPRLVFTRQEATLILTLAPNGQSLKALDFQASRATATSPELGQYRVIHFATHGLVDSEHPELSGLVLSLVDAQGNPENGFIDLQDIYNLNLSSQLVVLSACETGLGKEVKGEGLVGLTRGFMYAGAPSVVATLWKVDDVATAQFMGLFYKSLFQEGLRPSAAMRKAQAQMWKQKQWANPYYWAAFTIQGDWN